MKPAGPPNILALLAFLATGGLAAAVAEDQHDQGDDPLTQEELDRLTVAIKADIEELRGVEFPRDVPCSVAGPDTFREYVFEQLEKISSKKEVEAEGSAMKLLGLLPADMDLLETQLEVFEQQVAGFYDPTSEGFTIMPTIHGDVARITLAHELTHALDDQLYDIDGTKEKLIGNNDAQWAYHAVVEGSGTAVMNQWTIQHLAAQGCGGGSFSYSPGATWTSTSARSSSDLRRRRPAGAA